ncbi:MAG TPA: hypothetical protein PJ982_15275 [Lacipirellulaceae bacterium]|nr:hypothetical protein [Lacipirellulaceae bacterium]
MPGAGPDGEEVKAKLALLSDNPPRFRLRDIEPELGGPPIGLMLGELLFLQFDEARGQLIAREHECAHECAEYDPELDPALTYRHGPPEKPASKPVKVLGEAQSSDARWQAAEDYRHSWVDVSVLCDHAPVPELEGLPLAEYAVLEINGDRRLLRLTDMNHHGWFHQRVEVDLADGASIVVRPMTANDVDLLTPEGVCDVLADADCVAAPIVETEAGWEFSLDHEDQQEMARQDGVHYILRMAVSEKEPARG